MRLTTVVLLVLGSCLYHNHTRKVHALVLRETNNPNGTASNQPVSPINVNNEIHPRILLLEKPVAINANASGQPTILQTLVKPVALNANQVDQTSTKSPSTAAAQATNPCTRIFCPMIRCLNNLPPIPSKGICCNRCVLNPKCNTSTCPILNCPTTIIPANLTAGECCDHCPPVCNLRLCPRIVCRETLPPLPGECCPRCLPFTVATTKKPSETTKKTINAPTATRAKPKAESIEETTEESTEESTEETTEESTEETTEDITEESTEETTKE